MDTLSGEALARYKDKLEVVGLSDCLNGSPAERVTTALGFGTLSNLNLSKIVTKTVPSTIFFN